MEMESLGALMGRFPSDGRVEWMGVRPGRREAMRAIDKAVFVEGRGIEGDRYAARGKVGGKRQVTLIQAEHLEVVARLLGREAIAPEWVRRNVVVRGINLDALRAARFFVGEAMLEGVEPCHPCSRMEEPFGEGGYNAMRGHGGIVARVIEGGVARHGDRVAYAHRSADAEG